MSSANMISPHTTLADDLIRGAGPLAQFVFGDAKKRRQIYYLSERGELPTFKMGSVICARKSTILQWISAREGKL